MRHSRTLILVLSLTCVTAIADIAPTRFIGSGIAPVDEPHLRMESAEVDIVWGDPAALTATFLMVNDSSHPRAVEVGFPMPVGTRPWEKSDPPDPLSIAFNGAETKVGGPFESESLSHLSSWEWYRTTNVFAPGATTVAVRTVLRPSGVYRAPYTQSLSYCIRTGGKWAGAIGSERVTIRFPWPIVADQVRSMRPEGGRVDGNRVSWDFAEIEPEADEFDIHVTFIRPDFMRALTELRQEHHEHPDSQAATIRLAKQLLALGDRCSNAGHLPSRLTDEEHDRIAAGIEDADARVIFSHEYRPNTNGGYRAVSRQRVGEVAALPRILGDAGYRDKGSLVGPVREGEQLLLKLLEEDSQHAEAWNIYLANYWRFSYGALGRPWGPAWLGQDQEAVIRKAAVNCPDDKTIKLWLELCEQDHGNRDRRTPPALLPVQRSIGERGFRKIELKTVGD